VGTSGDVQHAITPDTAAAFGSYLITNVAQRSGCHSQHDGTGKIIGAELAGGTPITRPGNTMALTLFQNLISKTTAMV